MGKRKKKNLVELRKERAMEAYEVSSGAMQRVDERLKREEVSKRSRTRNPYKKSMKATREQYDLIRSAIRGPIKDHNVNLAESWARYQANKYTYKRFYWDVYWGTGANKVMFAKYNYNSGLNDANLGTVIKSVVDEIMAEQAAGRFENPTKKRARSDAERRAMFAQLHADGKYDEKRLKNRMENPAKKRAMSDAERRAMFAKLHASGKYDEKRLKNSYDASEEPKLWIGDLAEYNNGTLYGEWLEAPFTLEAFEEVLRPGNEEWEIMDHMDFPFDPRQESLETLNEFAELDEDDRKKVAMLLEAGIYHSTQDAIDNIDSVEAIELGPHVRNIEDFTMEYVCSEVGFNGVSAEDMSKLVAYLDWDMISDEIYSQGQHHLEDGVLYEFSN